MLDGIRNGAKGWMGKALLAFITIPFALWGIDSYFNSNARTELVAEVGNGGITRLAFTEALKEQADRMRQAMGTNFDPAATETRGFREQVLNGLVEEETLLQDAQASGLQVTDVQIAAVLQHIQPFQEDGKFSAERYKRVLAQRGFTPAYFENRLRRDLVLQAYQQPLTVGALAATSSVELTARIAGQRREVSWSDIAPATAAQQVNVTAQDVQAYFDQHKNDYMEPEAVRVEFAVLSLDGLVKNIQISEKQVQDYFASNAGKLGPPEQRSASHILIAAPAGDAAARKQAKTQADALLAVVTKTPKTFADVAKRESKDPGSASNGGSLGNFARGMMVKPFEEAVFSMKPGEMRLVESEFGFHIVRLDGVKSSAPVLAAVRPQIEAELRKQLAQKQFAEAAESFNNLVYEQGTSLKPAADALKLTVATSDWLTRKGQPADPLNSGKLLTALFAGDAIKSRQNIEPIEINRNELVAARVVDYRPAKQKAIAEVANSIREKLLTERTAKQSEKIGQSMMAQLKQGTEPVGLNWSAFQIIGRQQPGGLDQKSLQNVMRQDGTKLPAYTGAALPDGGYRVIRVTRVLDTNTGEPNPALHAAVGAGLRQAYARADIAAQIELTKAAQKVKIMANVLEKKE